MSLIRTVLIAATAAFASLTIPPVAAAQSAPGLIVLISIDQMRYDYITRFADLYEGGFARLLREGQSFTEAHHAHALTGTAPGHATISTGVHPARHGIPANMFWDRAALRRRYAVEDIDVDILDVPDDTGRSPLNLRRTTIGDWIKGAATDSKVFSLAQKDRAAVLMGGRRADGVYWYDEDGGKVVTSSYYRSDLPRWVDAFNRDDPWSEYFSTPWTKLLPDTAYERAREDSFPAEAYGWDFMFPHTIETGGDDASPHSDLRYTPFVDKVMLTFAQSLVTEEDLGADSLPDLLAIGLSSGDLLGHDFGPFSQELEDYYLRTDRHLGAFFTFLDERVGEDRYVVVLTADHGMPMMVEEAARRGTAAGRVTSQDLQQAFVPELQRALFELQIDVLPRLSFIFPFGLTVAFPRDAVSDEHQAEMRRRMAVAIRRAPWAADAFTYDELADSTVDRPYIEEYRRSFVPDRAPDIMIHFERQFFYAPQLMVDHGTPYDYDTHVPLIFLSPGVTTGSHAGRVHTTDIAPTLAVIAGVPFPADLDGVVLESVVP